MKGEPPAFGGVQICPAAAGLAVQPAEPSIPALMKLSINDGKGATSKVINGVLSTKVVPTGSAEIFRLETPFCPSSVENEPVPAVKVNICDANGLKSLVQEMVVEVTVMVPLMSNVPVSAAADSPLTRPDRMAPKNKTLLIICSNSSSYLSLLPISHLIDSPGLAATKQDFKPVCHFVISRQWRLYFCAQYG